MTIDNMGGRAAAILLAAALAAGGTSLLFGDVIFGAAAFTQKHWQAICIVLGTTFASLVAAIAWEKRHWLACAGFVGLAAAGTLVIVWYSLGRQTEGQMLSSEDHEKAAATRVRLEGRLASEIKAHLAKRKEADARCEKLGPEHRRCLGARAVEAVYADSVAGLEARLKALQVKPADASAEAFGNLANALGRNGNKAKALALLFMPYLITGLFELGFTMALHYAFRPSQRGGQRSAAGSAKSESPSALKNVSDAELSTLRQQFTPDVSAGDRQNPNSGLPSMIRSPKRPNSGSPVVNSGAPGRRMSHSEIISDLMLRAATGRLFGSNEAAAAHYGYSPSRFSELVTRWEGECLIPKGRMVGRCKEIASAS